MSSLINARTRFALDSAGRIFDYLTNKTHEAVGTLHDWHGGHWDLAHLKTLISSGQHIDAAHVRDPSEVWAERPVPAAAKDLTEHHLPLVSDAPTDPAPVGAPPSDPPLTIPPSDSQGAPSVETEHGASQGTS